jgi:hypothetical protein
MLTGESTASRQHWRLIAYSIISLYINIISGKQSDLKFKNFLIDEGND